MESIKEDFMDILENQRIKPVFQPIISLKTGETIGYEALSRIINPKMIRSSEELFRLAGLYGKIWELEQLSRRKIIEKYHHFFSQENNQKLFLNVSPMVIHDQEFHSGFTKEYLTQYHFNPDNIIFEVTEKNAVDDMNGFKETVRHYKSQGYTIAIDDAGSCYSGLNLICDIVPHYLKLDMSLIHNIHKETIKFAMVKSMAEFANLTNIRLIAEGIECEEELKVLLKLGVTYGQGYFLRKPDEELKTITSDALEIIQKFNRKTNIRMNHADQKDFHAVLFQFSSSKAYQMYCEKYGDEKGDEIIKLLQTIVNQNLSEAETAVILNGTTLLAAMEKGNEKLRCEIISNMFDKEIERYYTEEDFKQGYLECQNKHGNTKKYPLITICSERLL